MAISGDTIAVGSIGDDRNGTHDSGAVYVFVKPGGGWSGTLSEDAKLQSSDLAAGDQFGGAGTYYFEQQRYTSVAISGETIVVGSSKDDDGGSASGSAYVFEKPGGGWTGTLTETTKLTAGDAAAGDEFGTSVAIEGDTLLVGARYESNKGALYLFRKVGGVFTEAAKLTPSNAAIRLGTGVAFSGDTAAGTGTVTIGSVTFLDPVTIAGGTINDGTGTDLMVTGLLATLDGDIAPGTSPGELSVTGNLHLADNDTVSFEFQAPGTTAGTDYDTITASGAVSIGSNVTLSTVALGGCSPTGGDSFALITRSGGNGTFDGLVEGATLSDFLSSGLDATITYAGGGGGKDVVISIPLDTDGDGISDALDPDDDDDGTALGSANIATGTVPAGGTAILYDGDALTAVQFAAAWGSGFNLVAVTGFPTLGNPGIYTVNHAVLNNDGEILVEATLTGGSGTQDLGLWSNGGGNPLGLVALEGAAADCADFVGTTFKSFGHVALNGAGFVGAAAFVQGGGATAASDQGLFSEFGGGTFTGTRREGSVAPDSGTGNFSGLYEPAFAETLIAVPGTLKIDAGTGINASNDRGIWTRTGALVREGALVNVAGVAPAATYGQFEPRVVATGDDTVAFAGLVAGNGAASRLLLTGQPGNLRVVAARNQVIDGVTIDRFDAESLNDAGDVAFRSTLAGVAANANSAVFTCVGSTLSMVVRENDQATGQEPGVLFDRFEELHLIDGGDLVFRAYLRGSDVDSASDAVLYHYASATDTLRPVVREGDPAPSTDSAVILNLRDFDVNAGGGVVYTATLIAAFGDTTSANNIGLWLSPPGGGVPVLAARKGDEFEYAPGDVRTILSLTLDGVANPVGGVGSTPKVLSDRGQAIIKVTNNLGGGAFLVGGVQ